MAVDVKDLKKGDEVLVRATVTDAGNFLLNIAIGDARVNGLSAADIAQHIPRKIAVGDECLSGDERVRVLAIDGDYAWVVSCVGRYTTRLSNLERVSS